MNIHTLPIPSGLGVGCYYCGQDAIQVLVLDSEFETCVIEAQCREHQSL